MTLAAWGHMPTPRQLWHTGCAAIGGAMVFAGAQSAQALSQMEALEVTPPVVVATPSPAKSPGSLPPLLPPEGLPTAPPPDAIKPVVPQAQGDVPAGGV